MVDICKAKFTTITIKIRLLLLTSCFDNNTNGNQHKTTLMYMTVSFGR